MSALIAPSEVYVVEKVCRTGLTVRSNRSFNSSDDNGWNGIGVGVGTGVGVAVAVGTGVGVVVGIGVGVAVAVGT